MFSSELNYFENNLNNGYLEPPMTNIDQRIDDFFQNEEISYSDYPQKTQTSHEYSFFEEQLDSASPTSSPSQCQSVIEIPLPSTKTPKGTSAMEKTSKKIAKYQSNKVNSWTDEEDQIIFAKFLQYGAKWRQIEFFVPQKSSEQIRARFYQTLKRIIASQKICKSDDSQINNSKLYFLLKKSMISEEEYQQIISSKLSINGSYCQEIKFNCRFYYFQIGFDKVLTKNSSKCKQNSTTYSIQNFLQEASNNILNQTNKVQEQLLQAYKIIQQKMVGEDQDYYTNLTYQVVDLKTQLNSNSLISFKNLKELGLKYDINQEEVIIEKSLAIVSNFETCLQQIICQLQILSISMKRHS